MRVFALAPEALQRWLVSKDHMSKVVKMRAAIARNRSAVPMYLDFMGSDAGDGARTRGPGVAADPDDAVT